MDPEEFAKFIDAKLGKRLDELKDELISFKKEVRSEIKVFSEFKWKVTGIAMFLGLAAHYLPKYLPKLF